MGAGGAHRGATFPHRQAGRVIRALIAERSDPVLFELSYDYVGDLSETVALIGPLATTPVPVRESSTPTLSSVVHRPLLDSAKPSCRRARALARSAR